MRPKKPAPTHQPDKKTLGRMVRRFHDSLLACIQVPLKRGGKHIAIIIMLLLMLSLVINFVNQVLQSAHLEARRTEMATEVAQLEAQNQQLLGAVEYAESEQHVERVAREELGYAREGETVVVPLFTEPTPTPPLPTPVVEVRPTPTIQPNWQRWWGAVFAEQPYAEE
jgi:cell division protein FtsB